MNNKTTLLLKDFKYTVQVLFITKGNIMNPRLTALQNRVSHTMQHLKKVDITDTQWQEIFKAVASAPDYGSLLPYRFYVTQGDTLMQSLERMKKNRMEKFPDNAEKIEKKMGIMMKNISAMVIFSHTHDADSRISGHDQLCGTVCAASHFYLALNAIDLGCVWVSPKGNEAERIAKDLNFAKNESVCGIFMVGGIAKTDSKNRPTPEQFVKFI